MGGSWYRFRAQARQRLFSWMVLGFVVGVAAGSLIAAVAGARRTTDAYERFIAANNGMDLVVAPPDHCGPPECDPRTVEGDEEIADSVRILAANAVGGRTSDGRDLASATPGGRVYFVASADGRLGTEINRWHLVDGRLPNPESATEIIMSVGVAEQLGIHAGDQIEIDLAVGFDENPPIETVEFDVVGLEIAPNELQPRSGEALQALYGTPALIEAHPDLFPIELLGVRLHGGSEARPAFVERLEPMNLIADESVDSVRATKSARDVFSDDAASLMIFSVLGALAVAVLVGQALFRQQLLDAEEDATLRSMGCARRELRRIAVLRALVVAASAGVVGVLVAVALSPLAPIGEARSIEIDPGVHVDPPLLAAGALATGTAVLVLGALAGWKVVRLPADPTARVPGFVARGLRRLPGLHVRLGAGLALDRRRGAVPTASVLTSATLAVATILGAGTFAASLRHLQDAPELYGQPWDVVLFIEDAEPLLETDAERALWAAGEDSDELFALMDAVPARAAAVLADDPDVSDVSLGRSGDFGLNSEIDVTYISLQPVTGTLEPAIIEGRTARAQDEIVLGTAVLDELGLSVGDSVDIDAPSEGEGPPEPGATPRSVRIVGSGVFALPNELGGLGQGASISVAGGELLFIRFSPATDTDATLERFETEIGAFSATPFEGGQGLLNVDEMQATPGLLAGLAAFLGAATLVHFGVVAARSHAVHLARLRALGLRRRECVRVLGWHATLVAAFALAVGIPLGIIAGRLAWLAVADSLHVVPVSVLPSPSAALIVVAVLALALVTVAVPGWWTTRQAPATKLRAE